VADDFITVQDEISDIQHCYNQESASHLFKLTGFQSKPICPAENE
jgi:hypothetical protein